MHATHLVIGGGSAGCVMAARLSDAPGNNVVLTLDADHRTNHLGAELVHFAVATAGRLGGLEMIAHVQLPNVRFFEHLGWTAEGHPVPFHGVAHQLMSIPLRNPEAA